MRSTRASLAAVAASLVLFAACAEIPSGPPTGLTEVRGATGALTAGTCTTVGQLNTLAKAVFKTASPNVSSVLGKIKSLDADVKKGKLDKAVAGAHSIVDFTLKHYHAGRLPGTEAELTAFVNAVYCFAGIDVDIDEPSNSHLILPSDQEQTVYAIDGQAGIRFPANPVTEPTLIEFAQLPDVYPPGGGPLDTKLDQYPGYITITKSSETNAPLAKPAVVGVCAAGAIPQDVRDRLRLGHGKASGFEIAASGDAAFLDCENAVEVAQSGVLSRLANYLIPKALQARQGRGGGVGGTVTEFSPFAPVDPELRAGGGVGGTVTEFTREMGAMLLMADGVNALGVCESIDARAGDLLEEGCEPFVRVTTRLGTLMRDVPVTWTVTLGGGKVAARLPSDCGAFASTIVSATDLFGRTGICWRMGSVGPQQVRATPGVGGDAPAGVTFSPAFQTFDATGLVQVGRPTQLLLIEGNGQTAPAGSTTPIAPRVRVTDPNGAPIAGTRVHWQMVTGTGSTSVLETISDANGYTQVTWTLGAGANQLKVYINEFVVAFVYFDATGTTP